MRIQHNIMAMNAYRNYTGNTSALSKNLEKLSSGYKINRAGDDAAGLAISEKMRAQITGLKTAQKNAKDGISLIQTAEGSLTEVHDMLNRMVELADQSANGTYDNETDRANLQKEFDALRTEIDRIADSSNFNGIKLLDGSLSGTGATAGVSTIESSLATVDIDPTADTYVIGGTNAMAQTALAADGDTISYTLALDNGKSFTFDFEYKTDGTDGVLVDKNSGKEYKVADGTAAGGAQTAEITAALTDAMKDKVGKDFKITDNGDGTFDFEARTKGTSAPKITSLSEKSTIAGTDAAVDAGVALTAGSDSKTGIAETSFTMYDGTNVKDAVFTINNKKFVAIADNTTDVSKLDKDIIVIVGDPAADQASVAQQLTKATGMKVSADADAGGTGVAGYVFEAGEGTSSKGGLTLQIGDTAEDFNQMSVSIADMHAKALGLSSISIDDQGNAKAAVETIKAAINSVSSTRGGLGALQNRLDHTINNLSVMQENIQDAEASIRDVDVAEEMMDYTKNNILVQSAQAMLAQANQIPQGVLQLLQ